MSILQKSATFYLIGVAMSVAANVVLLKTNATLAKEIADYRDHTMLRVGRQLPSIAGRTRQGQQVNYSYGGDSTAKLTLVMVYMPACPYCKTNWPKWQRLLEKAQSTGTRVIAIDMASATDEKYVEEHRLEKIPILFDVDFGARAAYDLHATPTTMLIDGDGTLRELHVGPLADDVLKSLVKQLEDGPTRSHTQ